MTYGVASVDVKRILLLCESYVKRGKSCFCIQKYKQVAGKSRTLNKPDLSRQSTGERSPSVDRNPDEWAMREHPTSVEKKNHERRIGEYSRSVDCNRDEWVMGERSASVDQKFDDWAMGEHV